MKNFLKFILLFCVIVISLCCRGDGTSYGPRDPSINEEAFKDNQWVKLNSFYTLTSGQREYKKEVLKKKLDNDKLFRTYFEITHPSKTIPTIDFETKTIQFFFFGQLPNERQTVEIKTIEEKDREINVKYYFTHSGNNSSFHYKYFVISKTTKPAYWIEVKE